MKLKKNDIVNQMSAMKVDKRDQNGHLIHRQKYSKSEAREFIDDFLSLIVQNLEDGNTIAFHGFGVFDMIERAEKRCITPQGNEMNVDAHWSPKFYPGNDMRRAVRKWFDSYKKGI